MRLTVRPEEQRKLRLEGLARYKAFETEANASSSGRTDSYNTRKPHFKSHPEIAEQFVAQEMMAYANFHKQAKLYYWHREAKSSNAEVDFITLKHGEIIPVEVKSAHKGSMKS